MKEKKGVFMNNEFFNVESFDKIAGTYYKNYGDEKHKLLFFKEIESQLSKKVIVPLNSKDKIDGLWDFKVYHDGKPGTFVLLLHAVFSSEDEIEKFGYVPFVEYSDLRTVLEYCRDLEVDLGFDPFREKTGRVFIDSVSIKEFFEYLDAKK